MSAIGTPIAYINGMAEQENETVVVEEKKSRKLLPIIIAATVLGAAAIGGFLWVHHRKVTPPPEHPRVTTVMHLETFVVNLADEDQHTFLRVGVDLGFGANRQRRQRKNGAEAYEKSREFHESFPLQ